MIKPFKYEKKPGEKGTASCIVNLKDDTVQNVSDLNVQTSRANVEKAILEFDYLNDEGRLSRGIIPDFRLDETDLKIEFEIDEKELVKMSVEGPFLDARPFLENRNTKGAYTNPAIKVSVDVGRMRTHPARLVEKAKIYLDMSNKGDVNQLEMDAIAGKGDVYFRLKPNAKGVQTLRFEADDAGAALRAFNVYQNIEGGKLIVHGKANNPEKQHILTGSLEVIDFRVVNAPVLARLISAIGPTGIPALLSGEGLSFTKLEAKFQWHLNSNGFLYVAKDGRTSGNSLGITFEGRIDKGKDEIDMSGQIIPISMVNSLVSNIPLIGDILAGGDDGAVFAATYTVKGPTKEPTVTVNPLAALTPGIIRRILFE
jgi:hypothetical protein